LCLGNSLVGPFYGVFALEDINVGEFICEYTGEILRKKESERRTVFLTFTGSNYLFDTTEELDIDAYRLVCKMRFVNHSAHGYENTLAQICFVNGDYRVGLYAMRNIKRGEELFFDYRLTCPAPWLVKYDKKYGNN
jgi:SET domain-containing protein